MVELAPARPDRHGESWAALAEHRDKLKGWRDSRVPAKKMVELLARQGVVVPERTLNRFPGRRVRVTGPVDGPGC
jgi:hypothetical protein